MLLTTIYRRYFLMLCICAGSFSVWADGLPGEYLMTQRWRDMIAHHSPLTNPALMTEENYATIRGVIAPVLGGEFIHGELGLIVPIGLYHSAGFSVLFSPEGTLTSGDSSGINPALRNLSSNLSNTNSLFMLSYAWNIWSRLSIGANAKFAMMTAFDDRTMGIGLDFGVTYRLAHHSVIGDHLIGVSAQNLLAPAMDLMGTSAGTYSRDLKVSWVAKYWEKRLESAIDFDIKDFLAAADEFSTSSGSSIEWDVNVKLGAWLLRLVKVYLQLGIDEDALDYWGLALGVNFPTVNKGRDLEFLYQYNVMTEDDNAATGHSIYFRGDFGKHREEIYARKMARLASLSPNELYNRARKLYSEEKYWDAFFVFSRIVAEFPDFFKSDWVQYYRSNCQEELDMRDVSAKNYDNMKKEFPLSSANAHADLGLARIAYRNGDFAGVERQYNELSQPNVPDSLKFHGAYLLGQVQLQNNEIAKAIQAFSTIPEGHPDYPFAQHGVAVANARLEGDNSADIIAALENVIATKSLSKAHQEIINRSYVFMGYIFYEENTMSKAVVALRMVPTNSYYAEDALLGQGWTALKARQWSDCISLGQLLTKTSKKSILQCEGMLIQAYGHLLQKQYGQSLALLQVANDKIKEVVSPGQDTLQYAKMQYESTRMAHNFFADKIENVSLATQSHSQGDSLRSEQNKYVKQFDDYYSFTQEHGRTSFFSRSINAVKEDIDYALATVQKIAGQVDIGKEQIKLDEQQKQLDIEIERLKKEMEQLQDQAK